jgi:hypothetical protein
MAFSTSEAGPSTASPVTKKKEKRTAELADSSDEEALSTPVDTPRSTSITKKKRKVNGAVKVQQEDSREEFQKRKAEADRLFAKRQDLPFYQGRKMILEEIMKHETTIVCTAQSMADRTSQEKARM